jgi:hypothetical protein
VSLLCAALAVKVIATMIGPAGVGLFSVVRQFQQMLSAVASLGGHNAIVQGVASRQGGARDQFVVSVFAIVTGLSVLAAGAIIAFAAPIASLVFGQNQQVSPAVMRWTGVAVAVGALLVFFRSLLNAHMEIGAVAWVNVTAAAGALAFFSSCHCLQRRPSERSSVAARWVARVRTLARNPAGSRAPSLDDPPSRRPKCDRALRHFFRGIAIARRDVRRARKRAAIAAVAATRSVGRGTVRCGMECQHDLPDGVSDSLHTYLLPALSAHGTAPESNEVLDRGLRLAIIVATPLIVGPSF